MAKVPLRLGGSQDPPERCDCGRRSSPLNLAAHAALCPQGCKKERICLCGLPEGDDGSVGVESQFEEEGARQGLYTPWGFRGRGRLACHKQGRGSCYQEPGVQAAGLRGSERRLGHLPRRISTHPRSNSAPDRLRFRTTGPSPSFIPDSTGRSACSSSSTRGLSSGPKTGSSWLSESRRTTPLKNARRLRPSGRLFGPGQAYEGSDDWDIPPRMPSPRCSYFLPMGKISGSRSPRRLRTGVPALVTDTTPWSGLNRTGSGCACPGPTMARAHGPRPSRPGDNGRLGGAEAPRNGRPLLGVARLFMGTPAARPGRFLFARFTAAQGLKTPVNESTGQIMDSSKTWNSSRPGTSPSSWWESPGPLAGERGTGSGRRYRSGALSGSCFQSPFLGAGDCGEEPLGARRCGCALTVMALNALVSLSRVSHRDSGRSPLEPAATSCPMGCPGGVRAPPGPSWPCGRSGSSTASISRASTSCWLSVHRRRVIRVVVAVVVGNALALAVFGTAQKLTGATGLYFGSVRSPQDYFFASFVYDNHWGAFVLLKDARGVPGADRSFGTPRGSAARRVPARPRAVWPHSAALLIEVSVPLSGARVCNNLLKILAVAAIAIGNAPSMSRIAANGGGRTGRRKEPAARRSR